MIEYKYVREKELLLEYAERLGNAAATTLIERGSIQSAADASCLARFYWQMVDASLDDDIEPWLERIHNTLFMACGNAGFGDVWDEEVPAA